MKFKLQITTMSKLFRISVLIIHPINNLNINMINGVLNEVRVYAGAACISVDLHESDKRNALLGSLLIYNKTELCLIST
jgi:hypothetical protein